MGTFGRLNCKGRAVLRIGKGPALRPRLFAPHSPDRTRWWNASGLTSFTLPAPARLACWARHWPTTWRFRWLPVGIPTCTSMWRGGQSGSCACCPSPIRPHGAFYRRCDDGRRGKVLLQAQVLFAPNPELCRLLRQETGRACHLMPRGVDAELFHPANESGAPRIATMCWVSWAGLSVEKNVALLARVQDELERMGHRSFRFLIVGHGGEEAWLRKRLPRAEFYRRAERRSACGGLREYGLVCFSVAYGHVWECGSRGAGQRGSGYCDARRRATNDCAGGAKRGESQTTKISPLRWQRCWATQPGTPGCGRLRANSLDSQLGLGF